jgi:hypothetical protein
MEDIFISHLRIENKVLRNAVHALLHDMLKNTQTIDFTWFQGDILAAAFYNRANLEEYTNISKKLKAFVDDHSSKIHFAMGMPLNSTRPVESIPGFDWDGIFLTIRGLQTGTDQSHSMAMLSSTVLSQIGKRDFIKSLRRDTVDSDLKHAVGAMLVLETLKNALQTSPPGAGTPDDPIYYYHLFVDRVLRRFHDAATYGVTSTTPTFITPTADPGLILTSCFDGFPYTPAPKPYDNPPELRPHIEKIVHKILFAAAQVLLTDRRFIPDPVQFHKWTQYVVLPMYEIPHHPLAAKVAPTTPMLVSTTSALVSATPTLVSTTAAASGGIKPAAAAVKLPPIATGASVGTGVTWNLAATSPRPATATPSPRPRSVTPSKVVINAAAATENF